MPDQDSYASPDGYHRHRCSWCAFVWEHADLNDASHNAVPLSHSCPSCGRCSWGKGIYEGNESPRVRNGADPANLQTTQEPITIHPDQQLRYGD